MDAIATTIESDTQQLVIDGAPMVPGRPFKLVVHRHPDTDALCCLWLATRFVAGPYGSEAIPVVLDAGTRLPPEDCEGYNVLHMDTGHGDLDQHGKELARTSSFALAVKAFGLENDRALRTITDLTVATDNVERVEPTSIHYVFKGLPNFYGSPEGVDWNAVLDCAFTLLDIIYGQQKRRVESDTEWQEYGRIHEIKRNGLMISHLGFRAHLRDQAFMRGADVVTFYKVKKGKIVTFVVQAGRNSIGLDLTTVAGAIRLAEASLRGIELSERDAEAVGQIEQMPGWYLHDSRHLIGLGTRASPVLPGQETKLTERELRDIIWNVLLRHPRLNRRRT